MIRDFSISKKTAPVVKKVDRTKEPFVACFVVGAESTAIFGKTHRQGYAAQAVTAPFNVLMSMHHAKSTPRR
jgi:hypothetical protein